MWVNMVNENLRELNYMASLAGISANIETKPDHICISIDSYNDKVENFVQAFFATLQNFEPNEEFFEDKKD